MLDRMIRYRRRFSILLLPVSFLFFTQAGYAMASDLTSSDEPAATPTLPLVQTTAQGPLTQASADAKTADRSAQEPSVISNTSDNASTAGATPAAGGSGQASSSPTLPTPLTPGQKFKYSLRSSFKPPTPYAMSIVSGVFSEAIDNDHGRHMSAGDYFADSATHAARSFAFRVTANFFEKFAYASLFHQEPRYIRSGKTGFAKISYALSHVFITPSDSGHNQFNASFFAGGLTTAAISNVWVREDDRTWSSTLGRFGLHVAYRGLSNIIQEVFRRH
jgi:hypothetical protein